METETMAKNKAPAVRREEIFEAALRCFNKSGYYKTSIEAIAGEAGISKGGVYHHFASKKILFIELFHAKVNAYFDRVTANIQEIADPADRIRSLVQRSEKELHENKDILKFCLEFVAESTRDSDIRSEVTSMYKNRVTTVARIIRQGIAAGTFKDTDAESISRIFYFLSMGFFLTRFTVNLDFDPILQHSVNMDTIFTGIQKTITA